MCIVLYECSVHIALCVGKAFYVLGRRRKKKSWDPHHIYAYASSADETGFKFSSLSRGYIIQELGKVPF